MGIKRIIVCYFVSPFIIGRYPCPVGGGSVGVQAVGVCQEEEQGRNGTKALPHQRSPLDLRKLSRREPDLRLTDQREHDSEGKIVWFDLSAFGQIH